MVIKLINIEMILEGKKHLFKIDPEGYRIFKKNEEDTRFHDVNIYYATALIYLFGATILKNEFKVKIDHDKMKESIINYKEFFEFFQEKPYES